MRHGFALRTPCADCPFRSDKPFYLREERAREIAEALQSGGEFDCHKTTEETGSGNPQFCAGALILMANSPAGLNQMARVGINLSVFNPERLDTDAPVYGSFREFIRGCATAESGEDPEPEADYCGVAFDQDCENAAAFGGMGGITENLDAPQCTEECSVCGHVMCDNCRQSENLCRLCADEEEVAV